MSDDLVTIRNFAFGPDPGGEAEVARIKLEAAGIPCFLSGRELAAMDWYYAGANHGVQLQVKRSDVEQALAVLGSEPAIEPLPVTEEERAEEAATPSCPRCHSEEVYCERFSRRAFYLSLLLLGFPLLWGRRHYRCDDCGHTWMRCERSSTR
jgi:hypothetical protein